MMNRNMFYLVFVLLIISKPIYSQVENSSFFKKTNSLINIDIPKELLPVPFYFSNLETQSVSIYKGESSLKIPGTVFFNPANQIKTDSLGNPLKNLISALRFYIDTTQLTFHERNGEILNFEIQNAICSKNLSKYFAPFYLKKYEVTNKEYRQFTDWVRDSIARTLLAEVFPQKYYTDTISKQLNWKIPIEWNSKNEDVRSILEFMYIPNMERFYVIKQLDTRKFIYSYTDSNNEIRNIPIYPDTTVWIQDFPSSFMESLCNYYFGHQAFDDYPVVGVNYYQAKAFCHWKTQQIQHSITNKISSINIEVDIPNEYEWEYAVTNFKDNSGLNDISTITDLCVYKPHKKSLDQLDRLLKGNYQNNSNRLQDGYLTTHVADLNRLKNRGMMLSINRDENGISGLGDNVSEWMNETYNKNWIPYIRLWQQLYSSIQLNQLDTVQNIPLKDLYSNYWGIKNVYSNDTLYFNDSIASVKLSKVTPTYEYLRDFKVSPYLQNKLATGYLKVLKYQYEYETPLIKNLVHFYDAYCDKDGQLVRGGNWYDERFSMKSTLDGHIRNIAGINSKTFVSPNKSSCLIGFRYVVRIKQLKGEQ